MPVKMTAPGVHTLNALMEEGEDYLLDVIRIWHKMRHVDPGSEPYFDLMADLSVAAMVVKSRMESVMSEIDAITEDMPDGD